MPIPQSLLAKNTDKELAVALGNVHIGTHTIDTGHIQGSSSNKSEKLTRPKITQGRPAESRNPFQVPGRLDKDGTGRSKEDCGRQLARSCDTDLPEQLSRVDLNVVSKREAEQSESTLNSEAIPAVRGARRSETTIMSQEPSEPSHTSPVKTQGKAATCKPQAERTQKRNREEGNLVNLIDVTAVSANGLADADTHREVLEGKSPDECPLVDAAAFREQKEVARDTCKVEAADMNSGYKKQYASASPGKEAKPHGKAENESGAVPTIQKVRGRSRRLREHKPCNKQWNTRIPMVETNKDETAKSEEAWTLLTSGSHPVPRQNAGITKGRNKPTQFVKRARNNNIKTPTSCINEVAMTQLKDGAAVVLEHHIFDPKSGWVKGVLWEQPALRLVIQPCQSMYTKLGIRTPKVTPTVVDGIADTGAQVCLWNAADFHKSGYEKRDLIKVKQKVSAINMQPIGIKGAVFLTIEADSMETNIMALVTPDTQGLYLSRQVLTALRVIPRSFPTAGDAGNRADEKGTVPTAAPTVPKRAPCGCILRQAPPRDLRNYRSQARSGTSLEREGGCWQSSQVPRLTNACISQPQPQKPTR